MVKYLDRTHLDIHFHKRTNIEEGEVRSEEGVSKHSCGYIRAKEEEFETMKAEEYRNMHIVSRKVDDPKKKKSKRWIPNSSQQ